MQCDILKGWRKRPHREQHPHEEQDSPLQVRLIKLLGLKNYFVDRFVFKRRPSSTPILRQSMSWCGATIGTALCSLANTNRPSSSK